MIIQIISKVDYRRGKPRGISANFISAFKLKNEF